MKVKETLLDKSRRPNALCKDWMFWVCSCFNPITGYKMEHVWWETYL